MLSRVTAAKERQGQDPWPGLHIHMFPRGAPCTIPFPVYSPFVLPQSLELAERMGNGEKECCFSVKSI